MVVDTEAGPLEVTVPDGVCAGMPILIELPPPPSLGEGEIEVVVPADLQPGDVFVVTIAGDREFEVICPDNSFGGDVIVVSVPALDGAPPIQRPSSPVLGVHKSNQFSDNLPDGYQKKGKGLQLSLNVGGGINLNLALCTVSHGRISHNPPHPHPHTCWPCPKSTT